MTDIDIDKHLESIEWGKQQGNGEVLLSAAWEVFILGVSMLSVFNLIVFMLDGNPDIAQVYVIMDSILTIVFLIDLGRRLVVADDRRTYVLHGYGWIDILAVFPLLRILRFLRVIRMLRILRHLGGPARAFKAFFSNRAAGGLLSVLLVALLVMEFGSLAILMVERGAEGANIQTASDAIWYLLVTMSTVGYGDFFPVTDVGRIIGSLIILVGVGVFGTLTGFLANAFLAPREAASEIAAQASPDAEAEVTIEVSEEPGTDQSGRAPSVDSST